MKKIGAVWIMGNGQDYRKFNGFQARQREKEEKYKHADGVEVYQCIEWKEDMGNVAAMLLADGVGLLVIFGHSHGIGRGAIALAKSIDKQNKRLRKEHQKARPENRGQQDPREIQILALAGCDGVGRSPLLPAWEILWALQFRSLTKLMTIRIPENVQHLYGIRQSNRRPKGHEWRKGKQEFKPQTVNIDTDGAKLVHHDADPTKGERDIDEALAWKALEDLIFARYVDPFVQK